VNIVGTDLQPSTGVLEGLISWEMVSVYLQRYIAWIHRYRNLEKLERREYDRSRSQLISTMLHVPVCPRRSTSNDTLPFGFPPSTRFRSLEVVSRMSLTWDVTRASRFRRCHLQ